MFPLRAPAVVLFLLVAVPLSAHAAGVGRHAVPRAERFASSPVVLDQYAWDPAAEIRDWTRWRVRLALPLWIPGVTGGFGSGSSDIEGPDGDNLDKFFDAESDLTFAMVGKLELRHGRWGLNADGFAATIAQDITFKLGSGGRPVSGEVTGILVRGDVNYRFMERWFRVRGRPTRLQLRAYAGVRSYNVHLLIKQVLGFRIQEDVRDEWLDPVVGIRANWDISHKLGILVEGDIGGFGAGSEFAYWASAFIEWRFSRVFSVALGYSVLDFERKFREGRQNYTWNAQLYGPTLALAFKF